MAGFVLLRPICQR